MKRILFSLFLLLISTTFAAPSQPQKLTVVLDWFMNPDHAPLFVAQEKGFFKAEELDVKLIGPADPTDPPKWVATEKADIGITYEPQFMEQVDAGLPLVRIGTLIDQPLNCLATLKENNVKSLADLKGKRIGSSSNGLSSIMLKVMLEKNGLTANDVELVNVRYNLSQSLLSRKVDAVTGMMRNFEIPQLELTGHPVNAFYPEKNGIPNYSELIFVAKIDRIHDKRFSRFIAALNKATIYLQQHPQPMWQQFAKRYPEANNEVNRRAWFITLPYFSKNPANFNAPEWQQFTAFMQQNGLIKKAQPVSRYAVMLKKD